jgi:hypothetical protein
MSELILLIFKKINTENKTQLEYIKNMFLQCIAVLASHENEAIRNLLINIDTDKLINSNDHQLKKLLIIAIFNKSKKVRKFFKKTIKKVYPNFRFNKFKTKIRTLCNKMIAQGFMENDRICRKIDYIFERCLNQQTSKNLNITEISSSDNDNHNDSDNNNVIQEIVYE